MVSPKPVAELEAELSTIPMASPGRPVVYARVGAKVLETLRGVGGVEPLPPTKPGPNAAATRIFDHFRALAGQESGVQGIWIRQIELENP